jgi:hypothetical protein
VSGGSSQLPHAGHETSEADTHVESHDDVLSDAGSTPAASNSLFVRYLVWRYSCSRRLHYFLLARISVDDDVDAAEATTNRVGHGCEPYGGGPICRGQEVGSQPFGLCCVSGREGLQTRPTQPRHHGLVIPWPTELRYPPVVKFQRGSADMLVFVSDLHLTDESFRPAIPPKRLGIHVHEHVLIHSRRCGWERVLADRHL